MSEDVRQQILDEQKKREDIEKKLTRIRAGVSEQAERDKAELLSSLKELQGMLGGSSAEAVGHAVEQVMKVVDAPVLTREASAQIIGTLEDWLKEARQDQSGFSAHVQKTIDDFVKKYTLELDQTIKTRKLEEVVLQKLSAYLSRYT